MAQEDLKEETVDFAYAIDCTGSMSSYITQVKNDIESIVTKLEKDFPNFKLRLACVGYRDWCDDEKRFEIFNFCENLNNFKSFVENLKASGGGDQPEDVLGGLSKAVNLDWQSKLRVLFHICDAPPHNKMYHDCHDDYPDGHSSDPKNYHEKVLKSMRDKNIHLCIGKLNDSVTKMIQVFSEYAKTIELTMEERNVNDASQLLLSVQETLITLVKARKVVKEVETECVNITNTLNDLHYKTEEEIKQAERVIEKVDTKVDEASKKLKAADTEFMECGKKFDDMIKNESNVLKSYAREAKTDAEIEKAEKDLMDATDKLNDIAAKMSKSNQDCVEALERLSDQSLELAQSEARAQANSRKNETKIHSCQKEISSMKEKLKNASKMTQKDLKKEIKAMGITIAKIIRSESDIYSKFRKARKKIIDTIEEAKNDITKMDDTIKKVDQELDEMNNLLIEVGA